MRRLLDEAMPRLYEHLERHWIRVGLHSWVGDYLLPGFVAHLA
jgi:hypothetical protein